MKEKELNLSDEDGDFPHVNNCDCKLCKYLLTNLLIKINGDKLAGDKLI